MGVDGQPWNEPNWKSWLGPQNEAARLYRGLYGAGYRAVKGVDPDAKVLPLHRKER